ncbi:PREDICTED: exonuclease 1 isoform X2 [Nicotiana attenuata]|uniref:exonuclease 1 isoform X2 n=1 Tax=Nicotiana attenuata TaxID=49451 RepID=UPI0009047AFF|nr:PREDICTED: exonuclease 1 isoform X2 [Nicotiana attenuata]
MGIQGLLPLLKSIMLPINIKELKGCSVAVDTYSWLHKGAFSCSKELCKGIPTTKHIDYCMHRVNLLRHYGVKPILVFDGGPLPMKNDQENKRARSRKENLSRAIEHEANGNMTAAYECYQKAVDVSPSVAHDLIQVLKRENVCYIVAPYEADAQMTFLAISKQVDAVITEDSDLIAFGCPRIIYKMDKFGQGLEFQCSKLDQNKELNLTGFTKQMLLEMCILSGCDYLQSLPGMGLKKAHALIKKFKSYDKVIKHLRYSTAAVSPLYEESFKKAIMTFQHQRVYDPITEDLIHLSELSDCGSQDLDFLGPLIPTEVAQGIAKGNIDPFTMMPFQKECNAAELVHSRTYELNDFKVEGERRKLDLPAQNNLLTNYFCIASLEAKQKFRAPRTSPVHPNTEIGVSSPWADSKKGADSPKFESLPMSSPNLLGVSSAPVDDDILLKASWCLDSKSQGRLEEEEIANDTGLQPVAPQHPICKPCMTSSKERALDLSKSTIQAEKGKVIVRSSYFLKNKKKEDNQDDKSEINGAANDKSHRSIQENDCDPMSDARDETVAAVVENAIVRSSYFQHKPSAENGDTEQKEKENKRVIVRSSYFQHKRSAGTKENENCQDNSHVAAELQHTSPKASPGNDCCEVRLKKRKVTFIDTAQTESERAEYLEAEISADQGNFNSDLDDSNRDAKFGSNISHLGRYSQIAEKSIESFASVISSFRFTSNGSRASGLRAPLKDIKNTSTNRSASNMDLSKFVYKPTNQKRSSARRKV